MTESDVIYEVAQLHGTIRRLERECDRLRESLQQIRVVTQGMEFLHGYAAIQKLCDAALSAKESHE